MRVVEIRRLGPGDEVLLVQFDLDEPRRPPLAPDAAGRFLADPRTHLWVALDGGEPVGMPLAYELPRRRGATTIVHVYEIGVAPTHRRRGIGTALWHALAARFPDVEAYVLVEESNEEARAFYAARGLREPDERVIELDGRLR